MFKKNNVGVLDFVMCWTCTTSNLTSQSNNCAKSGVLAHDRFVLMPCLSSTFNAFLSVTLMVAEMGLNINWLYSGTPLPLKRKTKKDKALQQIQNNY